MDLHSLEYFRKVAELEHVTKAAEQLHVAQPSLSRTISNLEAELGVSLFDRSGKKIVLNQYGEAVLKHAKRILKETEDIYSEIREMKGDQMSSVSVSVQAASKLMTQFIIEFQNKYPDIALHLTLGRSNEECDLTVTSSIHRPEDPDSVILLQEELLLAVPKNDPLAEKKHVRLSDTKDMKFIALEKGKNLRIAADAYCRMAGIEPDIILESDSPDTVRGLVQAGLGICFIPSVTWTDLNYDNFVLKEIEYPHCYRYINLSWRGGGYQSAAVKTMRADIIRFFKNVIKQ
ncbi:MAG: LysR family transcriptional regulator [Solobacterium sp.]|nr:LysR family transcriptional regulator [Solobacterium sp.]